MLFIQGARSPRTNNPVGNDPNDVVTHYSAETNDVNAESVLFKETAY